MDGPFNYQRGIGTRKTGQEQAASLVRVGSILEWQVVASSYVKRLPSF